LDKPSNTLNILSKIHLALSHSRELTVSKSSIPIYAVAILALIFGFGYFVVGIDQGHLFSIVMGHKAFDELYMHELFHDMRHAAGFPCH